MYNIDYHWIDGRYTNKGLLLGMFACAALAGCSNDDIIENDNKQPIEEVNANLKIIISSATDSSRGAEDSGTTDEGIKPDESNVTSALIILYNETTEDDTQIYPATTLTGNAVTLTVPNTGTYRPLVILNPCAGITSIINGAGTNAEKYKAVLAYEYTTDATGYDKTADGIIGISKDNFMMTNRVLGSVSITSNNNTNPDEIAVEVERVASKITYRPGGTANDNTYSTEVTTGNYHTTQATFWHLGNSTTLLSNLNKATDNTTGDEIWVFGNGDTCYKTDGGSYKGAQGEYPTVIPFIPTEGFTYVYNSKTETTPETWQVKLDAFALVNLSKSVYAIRHIQTGESTWNAPQLFGILGNSDYMVDPKSVAKNGAALNGNGTLTNPSEASGWFVNALSDIQAAQSTPDNTIFQTLPTGDGGELGKLLTYCLENSVLKEKQKAGLVTGIVFRGQIMKDNVDLGAVYRYGKKYYMTMEAALLDNSGITEDDVEYFEGGKCYYFSRGIIHADGLNMEKAIMRNNIYSLAVTGFSGIGYTTITVGESGSDTDKNSYLRLSASILPWKVRFNNIEF